MEDRIGYQDIEKQTSTINGITFPFLFSDNETYLSQNNIKGLQRLKFNCKVFLFYLKTTFQLITALLIKKCYYGPFKGEFGHFTAHTLPFLMYLHKKGVKIHYCGMELHKAFLVDTKGASIIDTFYPLRDFFPEVSPRGNSTIPPQDVVNEIKKFESAAKKGIAPYWNIGDEFYYWFIHRHWLKKGYVHLYDLSAFYKTKEENSVCIFPRGKGAKTSHNNGEAWDYNHLISLIKPHFNKVYIVGHPSQSLAITPTDGVELRITSDNSQILEACSNSRLIITQHSGVNNLGEFVRKQVLIIYKGGSKVSDIGSMNNTLRFRKFLNEKIPLAFAFSEEEVVNYVKNFQSK
jgi:hypothetical protein